MSRGRKLVSLGDRDFKPPLDRVLTVIIFDKIANFNLETPGIPRKISMAHLLL